MEAALKDWLGSFWKVMIYPTQVTFVHESGKAKGKTTSAIGWLLFLTVFVNLYNYVVFKYAFPISVIILAFILLPLDAFFLAFWLDTISRKVFHCKISYYEEFLYLGVVIAVVDQVLFSTLNLIPAVRGSYLSGASSLYPIVLLIVAVQSLTRLKVWQAIITVILSVILALIVFICITVLLLSMTRGIPGIYPY
jgi:hypothetical protein